jgi:hypothetical protein
VELTVTSEADNQASLVEAVNRINAAITGTEADRAAVREGFSGLRKIKGLFSSRQLVGNVFDFYHESIECSITFLIRIPAKFMAARLELV